MPAIILAAPSHAHVSFASSTLTVDSAGRLSVTGYVKSTNFPTVRPFLATNGGDKDVVVVQIDPAQSGAASLRYRRET